MYVHLRWRYVLLVWTLSLGVYAPATAEAGRGVEARGGSLEGRGLSKGSLRVGGVCEWVLAD